MAMQQEGPSPGPRSWVKGNDGKIYCLMSFKDDQVVVGLRPAAVSSFHDEDLATATKEINAIIDRVKATNRDSGRDLAFLNTGDGLMLAWTENAVGAFDDHEAVADALGLFPREDKAN